MSFVSVEFLIFFSVFFFAYFNLPHRFRLPLILIASYVFYAFARVEYVLLIAFSTIVDYFAARAIEVTPKTDGLRRRTLLFISLAVNLGVLFTFKYFNFFAGAVADLLTLIGIPHSEASLNLILPVGISFYTFQSMSYTIDVYRGQLPAERDLQRFSAYIAFFPQLVAGPIERAGRILPQFDRRVSFDYDRVVSGFRLVLWGLFKKVVIADRVALYVNEVYNHVEAYDGLVLVVATFFFAIQIYCDFSGYSDIAIGLARVVGFDLMENFRQPYFSASIADFWRRWHISLSTWFRDYVYIPLGGSRVPMGQHLANLMIVFLVSGLWHGASWTFVVWGALHGLFIVAEVVLGQNNRRANLFNIGLTFVLTCVAWVFFRANTLADAVTVFVNVFDLSDGVAGVSAPFAQGLLPTSWELMLAWGLIVVLAVVDGVNARGWKMPSFERAPVGLRWGWYYVAVGGVILAMLYSVQPEFIYFQF